MGTGNSTARAGATTATRRTVVGALLAMPVVAWFARRAGTGSSAASRRPGSVGVSGNLIFTTVDTVRAKTPSGNNPVSAEGRA